MGLTGHLLVLTLLPMAFGQMLLEDKISQLEDKISQLSALIEK